MGFALCFEGLVINAIPPSPSLPLIISSDKANDSLVTAGKGEGWCLQL